MPDVKKVEAELEERHRRLEKEHEERRMNGEKPDRRASRGIPPEVTRVDTTFWDEVILKGDKDWIVVIAKDSDRETMRLGSTIRREMHKIQDKVQLAYINADEQQALADRLEVKEMPAIKYLSKKEGGLKDSDAQDAKVKGLVSLMPIVNKLVQDVETLIEKIVDQRAFNIKCKPRTVCVVFYMPTELTEEERNAKLKVIQGHVSKQDDMSLAFMWTIYNEQPSLQSSMQVAPSDAIQVGVIRPFQRKKILFSYPLDFESEEGLKTFNRFLKDVVEADFAFEDIPDGDRPRIVDLGRADKEELFRRRRLEREDLRFDKEHHLRDIEDVRRDIDDMRRDFEDL